MNNQINVLDHGHIRLVDHMGNDLSIVRSARVSYDAEWRAGEDEGKDAKLIHYLLRNKHTSPFESVTFTFEVKAPIFVFRQWHRHRTWCLAGDSKIEFARPADGKSYQMTIASLAEKWNAPPPKRQRQVRTLSEFNRDRISNMSLRYLKEGWILGTTRIVDVWQSGVKQVYEVTAGGKTIKASSDHKFLTAKGYLPVSSLVGEQVCIRSRKGGKGSKSLSSIPASSALPEEWAPCGDGYEVSNCGRVRSYWGRGSRSQRSTPIQKKLTVNTQGRVVVRLNGRTEQVSKLVAERFIKKSSEHHKCILHKDDNPLNNHVSNLYWGTAKDNADDSKRNGTRAMRGVVYVPVESVDLIGEEPVYDLTVEAAEHNFIANGFVVHNCYNEVSARYAELPEEFYVPELNQITSQHSHNKQMRTDEQHPQAEFWASSIKRQCEGSFKVYHEMLDAGVPRELARSVLPVGTYSKMFASVDLHNLLHFIRLRNHDHAQHEIRVYAEAMLKLIEPIVPHTVAAWRELHP